MMVMNETPYQKNDMARDRKTSTTTATGRVPREWPAGPTLHVEELAPRERGPVSTAKAVCPEPCPQSISPLYRGIKSRQATKFSKEFRGRRGL